MQFYRPGVPAGTFIPASLPVIITTNEPIAGRVDVSVKWLEQMMAEAGYVKVEDGEVIHV